jgi:hypothetical protein
MTELNGEKLEDRLYYTNLGFKAENSRKALTDLRDYGIHRTMHLEYAQDIVANCKAAVGDNNLNEGDAKKYVKLMVGDLSELITNPDREKILREKVDYIIRVDTILKKIVKMGRVSKEEIGEGIEFFERLIQKCVEVL